MINDILKNKLVWLLLAVAFTYWYWDKWGCAQIRKSLLISAILFLTASFFDIQYKAWKHDSPQIVTPNSHGSTDMQVTPAGTYLVIKKGAIFTAGWHVEGADGTYVLPSHLAYKGKNTIMSPVIVENTDIHQLPEAVYNLIMESGNEFKPPYLYGEKTLKDLNQILDGKNGTLEILDSKNKVLQAEVNWLNQRLREMQRELENLMSHLHRVTQGDKWYKALITKSEED